MPIEKQAGQLLEASTNLINAVTEMAKAVTADINELKKAAGKLQTASADPVLGDPPAKDKAATKKELTEIKKLAKAKAGSVLKALGKVKLAELLKDFGAQKYTDIKGDADDFQKFIDAADAMIADGKLNGGDDDLLGTDDPAPAAKEYTLEDVKAALLKVNNAEGLGREATRQILADLGVARLSELKADKFNDAMEKAEKALKDAEAN